jgi:hypothetical protein
VLSGIVDPPSAFRELDQRHAGVLPDVQVSPRRQPFDVVDELP